MTNDILIREDANGVATLTMNTPKTLNALSEDMISALQTQFDDLMEDKSTRVVILRGSGKAFCAGHNLKEMTAARQAEDGGKQYFLDLFAKCTRMMTTIPKLPQPVICQPHGLATAAGCQLVASCDMAVTDTETKFGVNGVNIGLFCSTPMVALSRNIPRKLAFEMLTTGNFVTASKAMELGLVNRVVETADLDSETSALASLVASKLGAAVKVGKQAFYEQLQMPLLEAYAYTGDVMANNMMFRDTAEGIAAFLEKRSANWTQD
ncbi:MAG: enoyl-CoA hydratase [Amylibacter sp.]|jgi:enoyl-CoA hydratase/carnithine racemase|nr:enoyl-CoA hydratase [Amylibacter sp.]